MTYDYFVFFSFYFEIIKLVLNSFARRYISQTQGLPTEHMLNSASKTAKFFYRDVDSTYPFWRLKTPEEHESETNTKSKEARKYIFNCLDDIGQVNVPTDLEGQLLAEKTDRREFIDLLKRMLTIDQERRITPAEALNHAFTTLTHLVDYAHCNNVKASVQMMEVCRRGDFHTVQPSSTLNFVPNTTENMTFTINNQLSNQVQRLVRERPTAATYDNLYQIYGSRNVGRQYANARADAFPHQLVSSILCPPGYQTMPSPTKHVVVGGPAPIPVQSQQYVNVPVPVSMVEPTSGQRMLLNRVQANTVAWPQGGARQVALVPSWTQQTAPHSLIVDSTPFLNMEEIYPKHHSLNMQRHDMKKESPIHHLVYVFAIRLAQSGPIIFIIFFVFPAGYRVTIKRRRTNCRRSRNASRRIRRRINSVTIGHMFRHNIIMAPIRIVIITTIIITTATTMATARCHQTIIKHHLQRQRTIRMTHQIIIRTIIITTTIITAVLDMAMAATIITAPRMAPVIRIQIRMRTVTTTTRSNSKPSQSTIRHRQRRSSRYRTAKTKLPKSSIQRRSKRTLISAVKIHRRRPRRASPLATCSRINCNILLRKSTMRTTATAAVVSNEKM